MKAARVLERGRSLREGLSRGKFLKMGGAGLAGLALLGGARPAVGETVASAQKLGVSPGNSAAKNRENLVKALSNSKRSIHFPTGDYLVD